MSASRKPPLRSYEAHLKPAAFKEYKPVRGSSDELPEKWLAELRTRIITNYGSWYAEEKWIQNEDNRVALPFIEYARAKKWNPLPITSSSQQKKITVTRNDLLDFQEYFDNEYSPNAIREYLRDKLYARLGRHFDEFGVKYNGWNTIEEKDYNAFMKKIKKELLSIDITNPIEELFEYDRDSNKFRNRILDVLCNSVIKTGPEIYFEARQGTYRNLLPAHWLNERVKAGKFDFKVWKLIPQEEFAEVLFKLLNVLPSKRIKPLLEHLPSEKLGKLLKNSEAYAAGISTVKDDEKRKLVTKTLTALFQSKDKKVNTDQKKVSEKPLISRQPQVIADKIASFLDAKSTARLSSLSRDTNALFKPKSDVNVLLKCVVAGDKNTVQAIIKQYPELLNKSGTVVDYSGRTILNVTPLAAAYGADDFEMLNIMFKHLDRQSKTTAKKQLNEDFPEVKESKPYNFSPLVEAITNNDNVEEALKKFRERFKPGVIEKGKHFNVEFLTDAYDVYKQNYEFWTENQRAIFSTQVIGYLQRLLPAHYAMLYCSNATSPGSRFDSRHLFDRTLRLQDEDRTLFYPPANSRSGLGFDFAVTSDYSQDTQDGSKIYVASPEKDYIDIDQASFVDNLWQYYKRQKENCKLSIDLSPRAQTQEEQARDRDPEADPEDPTCKIS